MPTKCLEQTLQSSKYSVGISRYYYLLSPLTPLTFNDLCIIFYWNNEAPESDAHLFFSSMPASSLIFFFLSAH